MAKFAIFALLFLVVVANGLPRQHGPKRHKNSRRSYDTMIVGGENAREGELPYQISLRWDDYPFCGASLINVNGTQIVITAAHCVEDEYPEDVTLVAGDLKLSDRSGNEQSRSVRRFIIHEDYNWRTNFADIALIQIDQPFNLTDHVQTIALPSHMQNSTGDVLVSGWGDLSSGGRSPDHLQKVQIPIIDDDACQQAYAGEEEIYASFLCAGLLGIGGKDSCQGDSGGPLVSVNATNGNYLAAIVSWGYGCADADYPGVNTETSHFIDWIERNVRNL